MKQYEVKTSKEGVVSCELDITVNFTTGSDPLVT